MSRVWMIGASTFVAVAFGYWAMRSPGPTVPGLGQLEAPHVQGEVEQQESTVRRAPDPVPRLEPEMSPAESHYAELLGLQDGQKMNPDWLAYMDPELSHADYLLEAMVKDPSMNGTVRQKWSKRAGFYASSPVFNPEGKELTAGEIEVLEQRLEPLNSRIQQLSDESVGPSLDSILTSIREGRFVPLSRKADDGLPSQGQLMKDLDATYGAYDKEWTWVIHSDGRFGTTAVYFARQHCPEFFVKRNEISRLMGERTNVAVSFIEGIVR